MVAIQIADPAEVELPDAGRVRLLDPETGERRTLNTSDPAEREAYRQRQKKWQDELDATLQKAKVDKIVLSTDPDASLAPALHAFFKQRSR